MVKISQKQLEIITETAVRTALEHLEKQKQEDEKKKYDRRLRNIKLLLRNYRSLVIHCEKLREDFLKFEDTSIQDLDIETINVETIEAIKKSKSQSLAMIYFVRGKLEAYKHSCNSEEKKYLRVLEMMYLTDKKYTIKEIADIEHIDRTTVNRYLNRAISELPVIFFGVDAIKFER
ncbi:hypothetical protein AWH56_005290 [Anaerobacillus isosaccharinicus]|uniref:Helix-turn-helix type 11 domain-containing protein n=1 Tax=Anaerobacillus isosaccharinicus TaxID=1532552 RepID=A0A7S7RCK7_9BACI|nr:hypothetical protein [Anaerobacillus isosaccharinicus]